eukprot:4094420-Amphidinium_carterae.1
MKDFFPQVTQQAPAFAVGLRVAGALLQALRELLERVANRDSHDVPREGILGKDAICGGLQNVAATLSHKIWHVCHEVANWAAMADPHRRVSRKYTFMAFEGKRVRWEFYVPRVELSCARRCATSLPASRVAALL